MILDFPEEVLKNHLTSSLGQYFVDLVFVPDEVSVPQVKQKKILSVLLLHLKFLKQDFPVTGLHGLRFEIRESLVHSSVLQQVGLVLVINLMASQFIGEVVHGLKDSIELILHSLEDIARERSVVDLIDCLPKLANFLPNVFEELVILNKVLKTVWVTKLQIKKLLSLANSLPVFVGFLDLTSDDVQGIKSLFRLELCSSWSLLVPLHLDLLDLCRASSLLFENLSLKCWNLVIHELGLDGENLLETLGPLEFYHIDVDPILRELISLSIKKFLTLLESIKLLLPWLNLSLDLFDVSDKHCDILRGIDINVFKLLSSGLDLLEELRDLLLEL